MTPSFNLCHNHKSMHPLQSKRVENTVRTHPCIAFAIPTQVPCQLATHTKFSDRSGTKKLGNVFDWRKPTFPSHTQHDQDIMADAGAATTAPAVAPSQAASPKKGGKAAAAKKPRVKPAHPRTSEMVGSAIKSLKERGGSSLQAIKKYVSSNYKVDAEKLAPFIKKYLKAAVASGELVQTKGKGASGSFKLASGSGATTEQSKAPSGKRGTATAPKEKKRSVAKKTAASKKVVKKAPAATAEKKKKAAAATPKPKKSPSKVKKVSKPPTKKPRAPKPKKVAPKAKSPKKAAPKRK